MRLSKTVKPPLATGLIWSVTSFAPSWGVLPQYWQVKLSLLKILNRSLKGALGFLGLRGGRVGLMGRWINLRALPHFPNRLSNIPRFGNPSNLSMSRLLTKPPSKIEASLSFSKRYSFEKVEYFVSRFAVPLFITQFQLQNLCGRLRRSFGLKNFSQVRHLQVFIRSIIEQTRKKANKLFVFFITGSEFRACCPN